VKKSRAIHGEDLQKETVKLTFDAAYESIGAKWSSLLISNASLKFAMTFF
jgi:hypothetical protein